MHNGNFNILEKHGNGAGRQPGWRKEKEMISNNVQIVDPITSPEWEKALLRFPNHTFFHSANWARVLVHSYNFTPRYLVAGDLQNPQFLLPVMEVKGLISGRRGVSLPFSDYCEPLLDQDSRADQILEAIKSIVKQQGWKSLQLRGAAQMFTRISPSTNYFGHKLSLGHSEEEIFSHFRSNLKRNLNRAKKQQVKVIVDNSNDSLKAFYHLNCLTRKKHGLPPQPFRFFESIQKFVLEKYCGSIFLARHHCQTVAAAIFFHQNNQVIYKFGASDDKFQHLRANNLIMWEAIRHFNNMGFAEFDFGKTATGNQGLRRYKLGYGAVEHTIPYYRYEPRSNRFTPEASKENGWHNHLFKRMPGPVLRLSGSLLYKHVA